MFISSIWFLMKVSSLLLKIVLVYEIKNKSNSIQKYHFNKTRIFKGKLLMFPENIELKFAPLDEISSFTKFRDI